MSLRAGRTWWPSAAAALSVTAFLILALGDVMFTSPAYDEVLHLTAGVTYLATGDFRMTPAHPPLLKLIAAASLYGLHIWPEQFRDDGSLAFQRTAKWWTETKYDTLAQWRLADSIIYALRDEFIDLPTTDPLPRQAFRNDSAAMFRRARITLLLLMTFGLTSIIFFWSRELWGWPGAAISVAFFCFDPNFIAHSGLVTTDVGVTLFMAASVYFFWRTTRHATFVNVLGFAGCTALAAASKLSSLLLIGMIGLLLLASWSWRSVAACVIALAVTAVTIWAAYGFRFHTTDAPLEFRKLTRNPAVLFANDHRLLPQSYLYGIARVRADAGRMAYLRGETRWGGFRSYFFWTFMTKTPIPTIAAIVAAIIIAIRRRTPDVVYLLVPAGFYFGAAVVESLNIGHRHLLPMYPYLYVLCGILSRRWFAAATLSFLSCIVVFTPFDLMWGRHLSYFNEIAGGPRRGWKIVSDSNVDWGEDLPRMARWLTEHNIAEPINFAYFGSGDPRYYGIRYLNLRGAHRGAPYVPPDQMRKPGILAISICEYSGAAAVSVEEWPAFVAKHGARLVGRAGYSILIFRVDR